MVIVNKGSRGAFYSVLLRWFSIRISTDLFFALIKGSYNATNLLNPLSIQKYSKLDIYKCDFIYKFKDKKNEK